MCRRPSIRLARLGAFCLPRKWGPEDVREAFQIVLMLRPVLPERACSADPGHRLPGPVSRCVHIANHLLGHRVLLLAGEEDLGAIDGTDDIFSEVGSMNLEED